jgi:hypothetical protein
MMLVVPTFIQLSVRRGMLSKQVRDDPDASNVRALGAFLNAPQRFQLPIIGLNETACKLPSPTVIVQVRLLIEI